MLIPLSNMIYFTLFDCTFFLFIWISLFRTLSFAAALLIRFLQSFLSLFFFHICVHHSAQQPTPVKIAQYSHHVLFFSRSIYAYVCRRLQCELWFLFTVFNTPLYLLTATIFKLFTFWLFSLKYVGGLFFPLTSESETFLIQKNMM